MIDIVVGLGWGDEGKGATVDALVAARGVGNTLRFNGGHQAAHNVIADGVHHTFSTFGSGCLAGAASWIGPRCTIDPLAAVNEQRALSRVLAGGGWASRSGAPDSRARPPAPPDSGTGRSATPGAPDSPDPPGAPGAPDPPDRRRPTPPPAPRVRVHRDALVTTPLHVIVNRARESARGPERHGSTGTGFGETIAYAHRGFAPLRAGDMGDPDLIADHLARYAERSDLIEGVDADWLARMAQDLRSCFARVYDVVTDEELLDMIATGDVVMEGAQGLMLDQDLGTHPHTTWSRTTPAWAVELCERAGAGRRVRVVGAMRTYATRHGRGPLPHEADLGVVEAHNATSRWAGEFRTAPWDAEVLRYTLDRVRPDVIALSHLDVFDDVLMSAPGETVGLPPVLVAAHGPDRRDRTLAG